MTEDPFRVLGVPYSASHPEIWQAWRDAIKRLHPDAAPNASDAMRERLTIETARINEAYRALRSDLGGMRQQFDPSVPRTSSVPGDGLHGVHGGTDGASDAVWAPARVPGGDIWRRPTPWVVLATLVLAAFAFLNEVGTPEPPDNPRTSTTYVEPAGWYVGNCVTGEQNVVPVKCTHEHTGKIVAQTGAEQYCPGETDGTVYRDNVWFCIDLDA